MATPPPSNGGTNPLDTLIDGAASVFQGVTGTVGFWSDPFGAMYKSARDAVNGLSTDLIPALTGATLPNLSLPAFLQTYAISFALSLFVAVILLVAQLVRTARGLQSGRDTLDAIGIYFPGFLLGTMFGPAAGILVVQFVQALSNSIAQWAYGGTINDLTTTLASVLLEDPAKYAGGVQIGVIVAWGMALGLLFTVLLFVIQLLTLYFSGVLMPLAAVWIIDPARRTAGVRAVTMWMGILLVHPLLLLLVGFALRLVSGTLTAWGSDPWKNLISLLVATLAIWAAILAPFFLLKYLRTVSAPGAPAGRSVAPPIGDSIPGRRSLQNAPTTSPSAPSSAPTQVARNTTVPTGPTLRDAATARAAAGGGVQTATAAGAARAGMSSAATGVAVASRVHRATEQAADTSVTPPPAESYGKDRP